MRRYTLEVNGKTFTLDVDELAADRFVVTAGDQTYEVRLAEDADLPGATISPVVMPVTGAHPLHSAPHPPAPTGETPHPPPPSPARGRGGAPGNGAGPVPPSAPTPRPAPLAHHPAGGTLLNAPMPGVVLDVLLVPGDPVRRGQPALILEAMKMRNTIGAPRDGVVAEIFVQPGQTVGHGDPLIRFEAASA